MPNWCNNVLTIKGGPAELDDFLRHIKTPGTFKMNDFIPAPENLSDNELLSWHWDNWGVKWDIGDDSQMMETVGNEVTISFTSAWSAPLQFLATMTDLCPSLEFHLSYFEPGMGFAGYVAYFDGCQNSDDYVTWETNDEYAHLYSLADERDKRAWEVPEDYDDSDTESTSTKED